MKTLIFCLSGLLLSLSSMAQTTVSDSIYNQGFYRSYHIHLPPTYNGVDSLPLVMVLHGGGGSGSGFMNMTYFDEVGDTASYISVFPDAYRGVWADGRGNTDAELAGIDDVVFLKDLIDHLTQHYTIDTCRMYLTGLSSGGMMTHKTACDASNLFAGYAAIAASLSTVYYPQCQPDNFVNMLMMHGTEDPLQVYQGVPGSLTGVDSTIRFWGNHNACTNLNTPDSTVYPDINTADSSHVVSYDFSPCNPDGQVVLYKVYGGGHTIPGGPGPVYFPPVGYANKDINGAQEIWNFFSDKERVLCHTTASIDEINSASKVNVFPNPSSDILQITTKTEISSISVYDIQGRFIKQFKSKQIDISTFKPGLYFLLIENEEGLRYMHKIQKM